MSGALAHAIDTVTEKGHRGVAMVLLQHGNDGRAFVYKARHAEGGGVNVEAFAVHLRTKGGNLLEIPLTEGQHALLGVHGRAGEGGDDRP